MTDQITRVPVTLDDIEPAIRRYIELPLTHSLKTLPDELTYQWHDIWGARQDACSMQMTSAHKIKARIATLAKRRAAGRAARASTRA